MKKQKHERAVATGTMTRRQFIGGTATGLGALFLGSALPLG